MRYSAAYAASCLFVVYSDVIDFRLANEKPDPVHHRDVKREGRKAQREEAKRLARMRKGV